MAIQKETIFLSNEDYETLVTTGTVTIGADTLTYSPEDTIYITPDNIDWNDINNKPEFAAVATSGSYNDLSDKPSSSLDLIPTTEVSKLQPNSWSTKTWNGFTNFDAESIWTDGENIYYSGASSQYVLNKATSTWSAKTWSGLTSFWGDSIWSDGNNIYCSSSSTQYVLNKSNSTWSTKTWQGLSSFNGEYIWTDGDNIYYSSGANQYVLNKSTSTWSIKTWQGLTTFDGRNIWTDGDNIYHSHPLYGQMILDKETSTWISKTWNINEIRGNNIWTDGTNIYYSNESNHYILNKETSTWEEKTWENFTSTYLDIDGRYIWTDGTNIYYSYGVDDQYVLNKSTQKNTSCKTTLGIDYETQVINKPQELTNAEIDTILGNAFDIEYYEDELAD